MDRLIFGKDDERIGHAGGMKPETVLLLRKLAREATIFALLGMVAPASRAGSLPDGYSTPLHPNVRKPNVNFFLVGKPIELPAGGTPAAGLFVLLGYLIWKATEMAVTNKRVIIKTGLVTRRTFELLLSKVESIGVKEGLMGRWLGYGLVIVKGTGGTPERFKNIALPQEFRRQVQQAEEAVTIGAR